LADEQEHEDPDRLSIVDRFSQRMPEAGVTFFGSFVLAMIIGFLLALAGQLILAMIVFLVAIISIISMLFTPSPATKARRGTLVAPTAEGGEVDEEDEEEAQEDSRPDLVVDDVPAPTTTRRSIPTPPPEPPPMEDLVVELDE
jgi:hypothetical protein